MGSPARAVVFALASSLALLACPKEDVPAPASPAAVKSSLRVGLPDGWKATPAGPGLEVGPKGRVVLQLESSARPLPSAEALAQQLKAQDVQITHEGISVGFVWARYRLLLDGGGGEGLVGVRQVGARTVWCSTTAGATASEVSEALELCRGVSADAPAP